MRIEGGRLKQIDDSDIKDGVLIIPENVFIIEEEVLKNCDSLVRLEMTSVQDIGANSFSGCKNLKDIKFSDKLEFIEFNAFHKCSALETITIPNSVKSIGESAFEGCTSLKEIDIQYGVKRLEDDAFASCESLKKIELPDSITNIGMGAFMNCKGLINAKLPKNLPYLEDMMFAGCSSLKHIDMSDGILNIGSFCFSKCESLEEFKIPQGTRAIEEAAFIDCIRLEDVEIPESVNHISNAAFMNCASLDNIVIPDKVCKIKENCFAQCGNLSNIKLSRSLDTIEANAFLCCNSLNSIELPDTLERINKHAFNSCITLERINFPEGLVAIGDSSFYNCKMLKSAILPSTVLYIGEEAFSKCIRLEDFKSSESLMKISKSAFAGCKDLKAIELNGTLREIGEGAFKNCEKLKELNSPQGLVKIGASAFENCKSLKEVSFGENLKIVEANAFSNSKEIQRVVFPNTISYIGKHAFYDCNIDGKVILPNSIQKVCEGAFDFGDFKYVQNNGDCFVISNDNCDFEDILEISNIDEKLVGSIITNWELKPILERENSNKRLVEVYNSLYPEFSKDEFSDFVKNKKLTFFNKFKDMDEGNPLFPYFVKGYYNLGGFSSPLLKKGSSKKGFEKISVVDYAQKFSTFLESKLESKEITLNKFAHVCKGMEGLKFKPEFSDFFMHLVKEKNEDVFKQLMLQERINRGFISKCYNKFEGVQKANTSSKGDQRQKAPTVSFFRNYFEELSFEGINDGNLDIAMKLKEYIPDSNQDDFDKAVSIARERVENEVGEGILKINMRDSLVKISTIKDSIDEINNQTMDIMEELADSNFTYEWLDKSSALNFVIGKLCNCCTHIRGAGYGIMRASIVDKNVQNMVVENDKGEIVAKTTMYVNRKEGYAVCNNFEVNHKYLYGESEVVDKRNLDMIYIKLKKGISDFVKEYNIENPMIPITQVNVGMNVNDLSDQILEHDCKAKKLLEAVNYGNYGIPGLSYQGDSMQNQYVVYGKENDNGRGK